MLFGAAIHWQTFGLKYLTGTPKHIKVPFSLSLDLFSIMRQPLELGLIVAKRLILNEWKSPTPPSFQVWMTDMLSIIQMEKLHTSQMDTFFHSWNLFLTHFENYSKLKGKFTQKCEICHHLLSLMLFQSCISCFLSSVI